jgi:hypothetical protein
LQYCLTEETYQEDNLFTESSGGHGSEQSSDAAHLFINLRRVSLSPSHCFNSSKRTKLAGEGRSIQPDVLIG